MGDAPASLSSLPRDVLLSVAGAVDPDGLRLRVCGADLAAAGSALRSRVEPLERLAALRACCRALARLLPAPDVRLDPRPVAVTGFGGGWRWPETLALGDEEALTFCYEAQFAAAVDGDGSPEFRGAITSSSRGLRWSIGPDRPLCFHCFLLPDAGLEGRRPAAVQTPLASLSAGEWYSVCVQLSTRAVEISVDGKLHAIARAETGQRFFLDWPTHAHLMLEAPARRPFVARNLFTARVPLSARMARASRGSLAPW